MGAMISRFLVTALAVFLVAFAGAPPSAPKVLSPVLASPSASYIGVGIAPQDNPRGLLVQNILPWGPAWAGGLRIGDVIVKPVDATADEFARRVRAMPLGKPTDFLVLRNGSRTGLRITPQLRAYNFGSVKLPPDPSPPAPNLMERIAEQVMKHYGLEAEHTKLLETLRALTLQGDAFRIPEIAYVMRRPFQNADVAEPLLDRAKRSPDAFLVESARLIPGGTSGGSTPDAASGKLHAPAILASGISPVQHLEQIEGVLKTAHGHWKKAFRRLTPEDREFVEKQARPFLKKTESMDLPYFDATHELLEANLRLVSLASQVDIGELLRASRALLTLTDPAFLAGLLADFQRSGLPLTTAEVLKRQSAFGEIIVAGIGDDQHRELTAAAPNQPGRRIAVLIDLGGADFYGGAFAASNSELPLSLVADLGGNDAYESNGDFAQGCGVLGVGILADISGDDRYGGQLGAQGCSLIGVGLLIDRAGRDEYRAQQLAQGSSLWGAAALFDSAGDDRFDAHLLSQGVGISGGIGAIFDEAGDDTYYAKGRFPSDYGTAGTYNGLSQGFGFGMRGIAAGGIGILYDGAGKDFFEAGDFSQGGGHYFGWGILKNDGRENDTYIGSRYNQGFTAHYALGTFIEVGGNDRYRTHHAVSTGLSMDLSSTWFEDRAGDDQYPTGGFSTGSSAHNSITVWVDRGGHDQYRGTEEWASPQGNYYHGGTSLSLVFDIGGNAGDSRAPSAARDDYIFTFNSDRALESFADPKFLTGLKLPLMKTVRHEGE